MKTNYLKNLQRLLYFFYLLFFVCLICSFRGYSSISIGLIIIASLVKNKMETGRLIHPNIYNGLFISCSVFYLFQVILLLFSNNQTEAIKQIGLKSGIMFVPLALCCSNFITYTVLQKLMKYYVLIIAAALLYCLIIATFNYFTISNNPGLFFYHALVKPFHQHAVQVSILVFIATIYLLETAKKGLYLKNRQLHFTLLLFFTIALLLLSSKLVILFTAGCFIYYLYLFYKTTLQLRTISLVAMVAALAMMSFVIFTKNQVSKRFNEILDSNFSLVSQQKFNPGIYFNGVQFRLLQVRFVTEILNEKNAWFSGVNTDAQKLLVQKYISTNMYLGDGKDDHGYTEYNTHNQFLESLLQAGVFGLLAYIFIFVAMIRMAVKRKNRELTFVIALLLAYSLNESVLERQYSIMIFTFFPLLLYFGKKKKLVSRRPANNLPEIN